MNSRWSADVRRLLSELEVRAKVGIGPKEGSDPRKRVWNRYPMLSKRGKANGRAKANNRPRAARANRKSNSGRNRSTMQNTFMTRTKGLRVTMPRISQRQMAAPLNTAVVQSRFFGMRFSSAPSHDEFPEGGLRIVGRLPSNDGNFTELKSVYGLFANGGLAGSSIAPVSPTGAWTVNSAVLFSPTSPLAVFAAYFRKFRFRKLGIEFTSEIPPGATTNATGSGLALQVAYEPDIVTADSLAQTYTIDTSVVSANCTRFPAWQPEILAPCINARVSLPSDELYYVTPAYDELKGPAEMRQSVQGAVTANGSVLNGSAALVLGKVLVDFVVDLYGFTNSPAGLTTGVADTKVPTVKHSDEKYPDADMTEFVEIAPSSNRLQIRPELVVDPSLLRSAPLSVQGARVSSKK